MPTAFITGANKGIGLEIARQLAQRGFRVILGARRKDAVEAAATTLRAEGAQAEAIAIDVADPQSVHAAAAQLSQRLSQLEVLVNNAGIVPEGDTDLLQNGDELLRQALETNTFGALRVTRALLPLLQKAREPRVINLSSGAGQLTDGADGWAPAYCVSKTALNGVTAQLAVALPGLAVNSVCPGWVCTEMGSSAAPKSVAEGADTPVWLATEAPHSLTGQFVKERQVIPW